MDMELNLKRHAVLQNQILNYLQFSQKDVTCMRAVLVV